MKFRNTIPLPAPSKITTLWEKCNNEVRDFDLKLATSSPSGNGVRAQRDASSHPRGGSGQQDAWWRARAPVWRKGTPHAAGGAVKPVRVRAERSRSPGRRRQERGGRAQEGESARAGGGERAHRRGRARAGSGTAPPRTRVAHLCEGPFSVQSDEALTGATRLSLGNMMLSDRAWHRGPGSCEVSGTGEAARTESGRAVSWDGRGRRAMAEGCGFLQG